MTSPRKRYAINPAEMGSAVEVIVARVERRRFTPSKNRPNGRSVPTIAM